MDIHNLHAALELGMFILIVATAVAVLVRYLRLPYTIGLVIIGAGLTFLNLSEFHVTPELILSVLVPPLIFEAAFHLSIKDLRKNIGSILTRAIPGVIITTFLVGWGVSRTVGLSISSAIVFGALMAATDPVAVVALFKSLGVPKRLRVLLEGESLINDGTAIVVFGITLAVAQTGEFSLQTGIVDFFRIAGGGILVGLIIGLLSSTIITRINDHLVETTITFIVAYGSFIAAESIHASGILAIVTAAIIVGNYAHEKMSPTTRIAVANFWEFVVFLSNSFVFLLIGLEVNIYTLLENWQPILWAIAAVLAARAIVVYTSSLFLKTIPLAWQHVMVWGGLRGAISLALALSLPLSLGAERAQIQAMTFGVVLFTILVQGISMGPILKRLGIIKSQEDMVEFELRRAQAVSARASYEEAKKMFDQGLVSRKSWKIISGILHERSTTLSAQSAEWLEKHPELALEELDNTWREILRIQRHTAHHLLANDVISEASYHKLTAHIDSALAEDQITWQDPKEVENALGAML